MKICIDPGHGNSNRKSGVYDPGTTLGLIAEADIVLALGLTLAWVLKNKGHEVFLTRMDDSAPSPLSSRDERAEAAGCDLLISLHVNSADDRSAHGVETFYRDEKDKALASAIQKRLVQHLGTRDRGVKSEKESQHPRLAIFDFDGAAALIELGFLSNDSDRGYLSLVLTNRSTRLALAEVISAGIRAYLEDV